MRLTDIMSNSGLSGFATIAMVLFIVAFIAIVVRVFQPSHRKEFDHARRLPLDDDTMSSQHGGPDEP